VPTEPTTAVPGDPVSERQGRGAHQAARNTAGLAQRLDPCRRSRSPARPGTDDRGRTQYLHHPKWRELRDLLNFYRLLAFGEQLPTIRAHVAAQLRRRTLDRERVLAAMLRIIDESAVRIGSEEYAEDNDSFGLSTLTKRHVPTRGRTVELAFRGKSGQRVQVSIDNAPVARAIRSLLAVPGRNLFRADGSAVTASDVNDRLLALTGQHITAKDFRTWNGTLAAFAHMRDAKPTDRSPRHAALAAIDQAAQRLANTRAVARAHYVHPHVVEAFTNHRFEEYLAICTASPHEHLDRDESELLAFLRVLLERQFDHCGIGR
jgi:DNA topoisomerase I